MSEAMLSKANVSLRDTFSHPGNMGSVFQRQSEVEEDGMVSADNDSVSSYNPPSASTPGRDEPDLGSIDPSNNALHIVDTSTPSKMNGTDNATSPLREQVKDALRSLMPYNISYNELVAEGVNPHLLKSLYDDIGQENLPHVDQAKFNPPGVEVRRNHAHLDVALPSPQAAPLIPDPSPKDTRKHLPQASSRRVVDTNLMRVGSAPQTPATSSLPETTQIPVPDAGIAQKTPAFQPSSDVAMERKDLIAQLLAAKTGKAIPSRLAADKQPHLLTKNLNTDSPLAAEKKPVSRPEQPHSQPPEPLVRPENKAQTELIRQKMEALKKEALAKAVAQDTPKETSVASSPASATFSQGVKARQSDVTDYAAAIDSNGPMPQIPGLFMTRDAPPADPNSMYGRNDDVSTEKADDRISIDFLATPISQCSSTRSENDSIQSASGHILPLRLPEKRPLAADSFNEPMPSPKRPFGRKDSHDKVEIVISEPESEVEVEDVEMELDEESAEEGETREDVVTPVSGRAHNIRDLPPLTNIPPAKAVVHQSSGIATPSSTAIPTPGKEMDKEELWKAKHQEIELMRKKIAQMEERRKAKQNATRATSPKTTGKAPTPVIRTSLARPSQPSSPGLALSPAAVKVEPSPGVLQSPVLTSSRPEALPTTPPAPLSVVREPGRSDDLRQKLLRRKANREETPSAAELEIRQAQLAEKRAELARLKREAEKREAEVLEESRLLEAQLLAGLAGDDGSEEGQSIINGDVEDDEDARDQEAPYHAGGQDANAERVSTAVQVSAAVEEAAQYSRVHGDIGLSTSDESGAARNIAGSEDQLTSFMPSIDGPKQSMEHSLDMPTEEVAEAVTVPQQGSPVAAPVTGSSPTDTKSSAPLDEGKIADSGGDATVEATHVEGDGSISMSDSASEDYEPAEPDQMDINQHEDEAEFYEPAEVAVDAGGTHVPSRKQAEVVECIDIEPVVAKNFPQPTSPATTNPDLPILVDDAKDGMQLTETDVINPSAIISHCDGDGINEKKILKHFSPYETPRRYFKNFRYHSSFPEMVSSGYRSLTFSNNIDPRKPFCPTELAGKACQDPTCEEQHFGQVALPDDKILAQMSTANNLKTKAEHERWVAGLRQVIADLRSRGVKDFHMVASALAAYRRRFSEELSTPAPSCSQS